MQLGSAPQCRILEMPQSHPSDTFHRGHPTAESSEVLRRLQQLQLLHGGMKAEKAEEKKEQKERSGGTCAQPPWASERVYRVGYSLPLGAALFFPFFRFPFPVFPAQSSPSQACHAIPIHSIPFSLTVSHALCMLKRVQQHDGYNNC